MGTLLGTYDKSGAVSTPDLAAVPSRLMNVQQLKKNIGWFVQLDPPARDATMPDGDWLIRAVNTKAKLVELEYISTGHVARLGGDDIREFRGNPNRDGAGRRYGFLLLDTQLTLDGPNIRAKPLRRR